MLPAQKTKDPPLAWQVEMDRWKACIVPFPCIAVFFPLGFPVQRILMAMICRKIYIFFFLKDMFCANSRSGRHLDRGSNVTAERWVEPQAAR